MKSSFLFLFFIIGSMLAVSSHAEQDAPWSFDAIVQVRITVPENARTAEMFGTNRVASGVVIDNIGHILTIGFQTIEAQTVEIVSQHGETAAGVVVAYDSVTGYGLLRATSPLKVRPLQFGRSSEIKEGDPVFIAGYFDEVSVKSVIVIAREEFAGSWEYLLENAIFTAPPVNYFSGAALINRHGHLVGIGYLITPLTVQDIGMISTNMFVPIDVVKPILSDLKMLGRTKLPQRPWLGVRTEEIRGRLFVENVRSGGPFEKAGIKSGDIILAVNKQPVQGMADFYRKVWALGEAGVDVPLTILQGVQPRDFTVHSTVRIFNRQTKDLDKHSDDKVL